MTVTLTLPQILGAVAGIVGLIGLRYAFKYPKPAALLAGILGIAGGGGYGVYWAHHESPEFTEGQKVIVRTDVTDDEEMIEVMDCPAIVEDSDYGKNKADIKVITRVIHGRPSVKTMRISLDKLEKISDDQFYEITKLRRPLEKDEEPEKAEDEKAPEKEETDK